MSDEGHLWLCPAQSGDLCGCGYDDCPEKCDHEGCDMPCEQQSGSDHAHDCDAHSASGRVQPCSHRPLHSTETPGLVVCGDCLEVLAEGRVHSWECGDPYSGIGCPEIGCTHDPLNYPHDALMYEVPWGEPQTWGLTAPARVL